MSNLLFDGFTDLRHGMDAARNPLMLAESQCSKAINVTFRGGFARTRPALKHVDVSLPRGPVQGCAQWRLGLENYLVFVARGIVYTLGVDSMQLQSYGRHFLSTTQCFIVPVDLYCIIRGANYEPVVLEARSNVIGRRNDPYQHIPRGTVGTYAHGRLHLVPEILPSTGESGKSSIVSGDIKEPLRPYTVLRFTETEYLHEGGAHSLPFEMGNVTGIGAYRNAQTGTGTGQTIAFADNGVCAFDFSNPRDMWKEQALSQVLFFGSGMNSPWGILNLNNDLIFRGHDGLRSLRYTTAQTSGQSGAMSNVPISREIQPYMDMDSASFLPYVSLSSWDNRLMCVCAGEEDWRFRAVAVYDAAAQYFNQAQTPGVYDGLWTGLDFAYLISVTKKQPKFHATPAVLGVPLNKVPWWDVGDYQLVLTHHMAMYLLDNEASEDGLRMTGIPSPGIPIESRIETRSFQFGDLVSTKQLKFVDMWVTDVKRTTEVKVWYRPQGYTLWQELGTREIKVSEGSRPLCHRMLRFSVDPNAADCDSYAGEPLWVSTSFQFSIQWTGNLVLERFRAGAEQIVDIPPGECDRNPGMIASAATMGEELSEFSYTFSKPYEHSSSVFEGHTWEIADTEKDPEPRPGDDKPGMNTHQATDIKFTTAKLHGRALLEGLEGSGSMDAMAFWWRKEGDETWQVASATPSSTSTTQYIEADLTGLTESTRYEFMAKGVWETEEVFGDILTFTTLSPDGIPGTPPYGGWPSPVPPEEPEDPQEPSVTTQMVQDLEDTSATLVGSLDSLGDYDSAAAYFRWREQGEGAWNFTSSAGTLYEPGSFSWGISGLELATTYEYQAVAKVHTGEEFFGEILTFETGDEEYILPRITTGRPWGITSESAVLRGWVEIRGATTAVEVSLQYRLAGSATWDTGPIESKTATGGFSRAIAGLTPGTSYECQAIGTWQPPEGSELPAQLEGLIVAFETPVPVDCASTEGTEIAPEAEYEGFGVQGELIQTATDSVTGEDLVPPSASQLLGQTLVQCLIEGGLKYEDTVAQGPLPIVERTFLRVDASGIGGLSNTHQCSIAHETEQYKVTASIECPILKYVLPESLHGTRITDVQMTIISTASRHRPTRVCLMVLPSGQKIQSLQELLYNSSQISFGGIGTADLALDTPLYIPHPAAGEDVTLRIAVIPDEFTDWVPDYSVETPAVGETETVSFAYRVGTNPICLHTEDLSGEGCAAEDGFEPLTFVEKFQYQASASDTGTSQADISPSDIAAAAVTALDTSTATSVSEDFGTEGWYVWTYSERLLGGTYRGLAQINVPVYKFEVPEASNAQALLEASVALVASWARADMEFEAHIVSTTDATPPATFADFEALVDEETNSGVISIPNNFTHADLEPAELLSLAEAEAEETVYIYVAIVPVASSDWEMYKDVPEQVSGQSVRVWDWVDLYGPTLCIRAGCYPFDETWDAVVEEWPAPPGDVPLSAIQIAATGVLSVDYIHHYFWRDRSMRRTQSQLDGAVAYWSPYYGWFSKTIPQERGAVWYVSKVEGVWTLMTSVYAMGDPPGVKLATEYWRKPGGNQAQPFGEYQFDRVDLSGRIDIRVGSSMPEYFYNITLHARHTSLSVLSV